MEHNEQQRTIATNITTEQFSQIIKFLQNNDWKVIASYDNKLYDKGIDFVFYQFRKDSGEILLAWDNWEEGEMQGSKEIINAIAQQIDISFCFGNPGYLHQEGVLDKMHPLLTYYQQTH